MVPRRRVTLREVAKGAGVSTSAASYALSGGRGVSEQTRAKVVEVATSLGWVANPAARALSNAHANAIGFSMVRPKNLRTIDTYFVQMMSGLEQSTSKAGMALVLHLAESEEAIVEQYRVWSAGRHVDGVVMMDLIEDDPRIEAVRELGMPAAVIGGGSADLPGIGSVVVDVMDATRQIAEYLWALGHRRIARVAGPSRLLHTQERSAAFATIMAELGGIDQYRVEYAEYTVDDGSARVRQLLSSSHRPTAIVFDNDVVAASALAVANEMSLQVPDELSIVAWDDSDICTIVRPTLTAFVQKPLVQASEAVNVLLELMDSGLSSRRVLPLTSLKVRGSTAPAPAG